MKLSHRIDWLELRNMSGHVPATEGVVETLRLCIEILEARIEDLEKEKS